MKVENLDDPFLQEEHQADAKLTKIAESKLNKEAA
jgi:ferritin-like metal-binding protein YciE